MEATKTAAKVIGSLLIGLAALAVPAHALADTEIHSSNSCEDCKNESGDAYASSTATTHTGQQSGNGGVNYQEGDNETEVDQTTSAESGDSVSGQVIGVVSQPGSNVSIFSSNYNKDVKNSTGNAMANGQLVTFTGQYALSGGVNAQLGDNETDVTQSTTANSGDAVSGGVIGVA